MKNVKIMIKVKVIQLTDTDYQQTVLRQRDIFIFHSQVS